ncbi:MAG TPA: universal stress protein [Devosia sp.]|nr:universal stress protein [Devosia sp.]
MANSAAAPSFFLPLLTYPDPTPLTALPRALDFCATLAGHLKIAVHLADIPHISNLLGDILVDVDAMIAAAEAQSRTAGSEMIHIVRHQADRMSIGCEIVEVTGRPELAGDSLSRLARTSDYTLLLTSHEDGASHGLAEAVIFGSGGPALLFPALDAPSHLEEIAIAWDGSRAAARALHDSVPILKRSGKTLILTARHDKPIDRTGLAGAQQFLLGHGIASSVEELPETSQEIGQLLQRAALDRGCGLLIMGAYGHSRFREFVLGGATRAVLAHQQITVLLSH